MIIKGTDVFWESYKWYKGAFVFKYVKLSYLYLFTIQFHKDFSSILGIHAGFSVPHLIVTSLAKEGYVFDSVGLAVYLFVCLLVSNITQNVMNRLQ